MRTVVLLAALGLGTLTGAARPAPVPRETEAEKIKRLYGAPDDPDHVCQFRLDGNLLHLTAAKGLRGLNPRMGLVNAPRTLKPVEGDFVVTVRMTRDAVADGTGKASSEYTPSGGGGLLVWVDAETHLRLSRSQWLADENGKPRSSYNVRGVLARKELSHQEMLDGTDTAPVTFRVRRAGNKVSADYRQHGKDWKNYTSHEIDLPSEVKVGVYAAHNFNQPLEIVFEPLVIEKPAK